MLILRILLTNLLLHSVYELVRPVDIDKGALQAWSAPHDALLPHVNVGTLRSFRLLRRVHNEVLVSWVLEGLRLRVKV